MIKAVVFDLDNTLVDFMAMKHQAIDAAIHAMRDAGLRLPAEEIRKRIDAIYAEGFLQVTLPKVHPHKVSVPVATLNAES